MSPYMLLRTAARRLVPLAPLSLLGGCQMIVLNPAGDIARQQADVLIEATVLMLIIIVPVMLLTALFAWRYRAGNEAATYKPDWSHSTVLEMVIWGAPLLIIICLGALTWVSTHLLDPYRPLSRIAPGQAIAADVKPLEVEVVALDWKWLFIYPEQGVATVNELVAPAGRPIHFRISASTVMNSFYIPALAGQIYAMPGMVTQLHGVFNQTGDFTGLSANFSGDGFSKMRFAARSVSTQAFDGWVNAARASSDKLDRAAYLTLEKPSEDNPVRHFGAIDPKLFAAVIDRCVDPDKMCMHDMAAIDAHGGMGLAGAFNVRGQQAPGGGLQASGGRHYVAAGCTSPLLTDPAGKASHAMPAAHPVAE